jgi:hypothetical protein
MLDFNELVNHGMIHREDLELFKFIDTPGEAFAYLKDFLTQNYLNPTKKGSAVPE